MPARLRACAADARAPQPAVCQAPIGAIGFLPPTARLCLRRPSDARSAERGTDANPVSRAPQAFQRAGAASCQAPFGAIGFRLPTARLRLRRPSDARSAERGRYLFSTPSSRDGVECVLCVPRERALAPKLISIWLAKEPRSLVGTLVVVTIVGTFLSGLLRFPKPYFLKQTKIASLKRPNPRQVALQKPVPNIAAWPQGWGSNCVPEPLQLPVGHARRLSQAVASAETLRLSLRVASAFGAACAIPGWMLLASARVARHAACDHEKLTKCSMADHRMLRPARLQIK